MEVRSIAAVTPKPKETAVPLALREIRAVNNEIVVELRRVGTKLLNPADLAGVMLELTAAGKTKQWPLMLVDPGLRGLNGPKKMRR